MEKDLILRVLMTTIIALLLSTCTNTTQSTAPTPSVAVMPTGAQPVSSVGYLEGRVTIGPLRPVEKAGEPTPTTSPEVFTARSLDIFQADGVTLVTNAKINSDGAYRVALALGIYVVKLARTGVDRASQLPQTITIEGGKTVHLDIGIDTGIR